MRKINGIVMKRRKKIKIKMKIIIITITTTIIETKMGNSSK